MSPPTLVLGIGNILLGDEGAGVHAVRRLQRQGASEGVAYLDGGTLGLALAGRIAECERLIVIDAAELECAAGTVHSFVDEAMDGFLSTRHGRSVHEVGLIDLMAMARLSGRLPQRRALVGIQPETVHWGERPGARVGAALPVACDTVADLIREWRQ
ncbi:MAG: hydrogenase maturation protease [Gammaproteobacteria bacterium]|nr:hydrogenase maturation protease [Gammaproteobacteria bacterium]NIR96774.1 hydrogenase maturation protease [Gammaproteobacteria bacterium]NIT62479.1 hydrogenase maturation protease [Gammaproteobacteria bacterium]NIV19414.1 hydrogenase maturation protease [Gammaproteobacteria bacterium]NIX10502.1 hydrogenase maturation protease [Gammaproteobacteria bacterium]